MGKIRARTDGEMAARKAEILQSAAERLIQKGYDAITLTTLAESTSISRTSIYTYYERKEDIFVDLMIQEYKALEEAITESFKEKKTREDFCQCLTEILFDRPVLLKLLSLQLPVRDGQYSDEMMRRFVAATIPYAKALREALSLQFPEASADDTDRFMVQYSMYVNTLHMAGHLPDSLRDALEQADYTGRIPDAKAICYDGLMLLSAALQHLPDPAGSRFLG